MSQQRPPARLLWPADQSRPLLAKVSRVERVVLEMTHRRVTAGALSVAASRRSTWLSNKLSIGKLEDYRNFSDRTLALLESLLEDPARSWPLDRRGLHYTDRPRRADGTFGERDDPARNS